MKIQLILAEHFPFLDVYLLKTRLSWSIRLRWLAASGFFLATFFAKYTLKLNVPYERIWVVLAILVTLNLIYYSIQKIVKEFSFQTELIFLSIHILIDLLLLTILLHYSGGIENPIFLFYFFHVVIASIIFPGIIPFFISTYVIILFVGLIYAEFTGLVKHYCIFQGELHDNLIYIFLVFIVFSISVYVLTYICITFMKIFRSIKKKVDESHKKLVEADKQKTQFFRFTSHELKSPIIAVKSSIDGIIKSYDSKLDTKAMNLLRRSSARADQMLDIIRELLILSKKRKVLEKQPQEVINFRDILTEIVKEEKINADTKNITIDLNLTCNNLYFRAEKDDIQKIFSNLINNAVRYTPENGNISVSCKSFPDKIQIDITDNGIGIPGKDINNIFKEFYRSENAKKLISFGTGLGLSLVRQIVENYQGRVEVKSKLNEGTTFSVIFPVSHEMESLK